MIVAPRFRTFWRRLWAGYVDTLVFAPLMWLDHWIWEHASPLGFRVLWVVLFSLSFPAYAVYMHGRFGQTLGKRLLRVKVTDISGRALTMSQSLRREAINLPVLVWSLGAGLVLILSGSGPHDPLRSDYGPPAGIIFGLFGLEVLSTLGSRQRRAVHDLVAGSVVVRLGSPDEAAGPAAATDAFGTDDLEQVTSPPAANQFACVSCSVPVNLGASHCRNCEQAFEYQDGRPFPKPPAS
jgi:uncharacterized RDD family membrane protein YckC